MFTVRVNGRYLESGRVNGPRTEQFENAFLSIFSIVSGNKIFSKLLQFEKVFSEICFKFFELIFTVFKFFSR